MVCGRPDCGRVLDELRPRSDGANPEVGSEWGPEFESVWGANGGLRLDWPRVAKPGQRREAFSRQPHWEMPHHGGQYRLRYECHSRCGAVYVIRSERLDQAYRDALASGRERIVAGVDVG